MVGHLEFVCDGEPLVGETMTHGTWWRGGLVDRFFPPTLSCGQGWGTRLVRGRAHGAEWLRLLRAVAIDGNCLQPQLPRLDVGFADLFHGGRLGHVDGLGDCARDER